MYEDEDDVGYDPGWWDRQHQERLEAWDASEYVKWLVVVNIGGGLWEQIIEVRHIAEGEHADEDGEYWDREGNTDHNPMREQTDGCHRQVFSTKEDADIFLDGAKFFRKFMKLNFFNEG